jgi:hypothetical protein
MVAIRICSFLFRFPQNCNFYKYVETAAYSMLTQKEEPGQRMETRDHTETPDELVQLMQRVIEVGRATHWISATHCNVIAGAILHVHKRHLRPEFHAALARKKQLSRTMAATAD